MAIIKLTKNSVAIVDDALYEMLSNLSWHYTGMGYAETTIMIKGGHSKNILMHRFIMDAKKGEYIDHINGNKLDNRIENLRVCTHAQNMANMKTPSTNKTGYKGVHKRKQKGKEKYIAMCSLGNKTKYIGIYPTAKEAAIAYNEEAIKHRGEYAKLNQIEE